MNSGFYTSPLYFERLALTDFASSSQVQGGEIGMSIDPAHESSVTSVVQGRFSDFSSFKNSVHVFTVTGTGYDEEAVPSLFVAELLLKGSIQRAMDLSELDVDGTVGGRELVLFRYNDQAVRELSVRNAQRNTRAENIDSNYNFPGLLSAPLNSFIDKKVNYQELAEALADCLLEQPFATDSENQRQKFICSAFSLLCLQCAILEKALLDFDTVKTKALAQLDKPHVVQELMYAFENIGSIRKLLEVHPILKLNYRAQIPASLHKELDQLSSFH